MRAKAIPDGMIGYLVGKIVLVSGMTLVGLALGLEPKELGMSRHVVRPTSVIDWTTSVVAGVGA